MRDIQRTLLRDLLNILSRIPLRGYHPLRRDILSDTLQVSVRRIKGAHTPHLPHVSMWDSVCPIPLSIAFTNGISIDFFSCPY